MEKAEALKGVPIFAGLSPRDRLLIAMITTEDELEPDEILCEEGDEGEELYLVLSGEVAVLKQFDSLEMKELARISPGGCVGEASLFTGNPRNATLKVILPARILFLNRVLLHELILDYPQMALEILKIVLMR